MRRRMRPATSAPSETERQEAETPAAPPVGEQQPVESGVPEGNASDALPTGGSSNSQDSSSNKPDASPESTVPTCTVSISCAAILENLDRLNAEKADLIPADGVLLAPTAVEFTEGESIFDVLKRVCRENKIHMEFSETPVYQSAYIEGIGNLYEFDCGERLGLDVPRERRISQLRLLALYPRGRRHRRVGLHLRLRRGCRRRARRMKHHAFLACHPAVNLLYFVLVLTFSMFFLHPLCLAVSLCAALWCAAQLNGGTAVRRTALWLAPTALLAALVNLAFNHQGATILAYLPSGNPLTLESIAYGFAAAAMLAAVVLWFSCWNTVMTSDKLMHLFGRVVPALSLLLSMTLRFVPRFQAKLREVTAARRGMGLYAEKGRLQKLKSAVTVFSVMVTWSLENAVETADSMKSRGYGLPGRTAFSLYRYSRRDRLLLLWLALCGAYVAAGWALGGVKWRYYPTARGVLTPYSASVLLAYFLLCLTPVLLQRKEARTWSSIASKA